MITPEKVKRILELADQGYNFSQIAIAVGISRNSVRKYVTLYTKDKEEEEEEGIMPDREEREPSYLREWLEAKFEAENVKRAQELAELKALVKNVCDMYPEICRKLEKTEKLDSEVSAIKESISTAKKQIEKEPPHRDVKDYMGCPECGKAFRNWWLRNLSEECEKNPELCQEIVKTLKEKSTLFPGVKVEEPKEEEKKGFFL